MIRIRITMIIIKMRIIKYNNVNIVVIIFSIVIFVTVVISEVPSALISDTAKKVNYYYCYDC